jgi:hypothetical protein
MVILFDQYNLPEDVYEIIFSTEQQVEVAKMLIAELKAKKGELDKTQMSDFATKLHEGVTIRRPVKVGPITSTKQEIISYNKRQFYDRILTPMKGMGLIDYDLYKKTYKLSDKFTRATQKLSALWASEARRVLATKRR